MIKRNMLLLLFIFTTAGSLSQTKPNIIYIMADDLGYADLSCYGRKDYQTSHLDKLAAAGVKFMNAYAAAPVCTPTRTAFMTGRYPARTPVGLREPLIDTTIGLSPDYTSLPALLKKAGYETYLVGKWHLGSASQYSPIKNGFDYFYGFHGGGIDYISHTDSKGNNDLYENDQPAPTKGYMTDLLMDKTIEIIRNHHSKPFFISLMFNAPHWPWQGPLDKPYPNMMRWTSGGSPFKPTRFIKQHDQSKNSYRPEEALHYMHCIS